MTDKEQIKAIIKQYADKGERLFLEASESNESYAESYWDGYKDCADGLLRELEDIQEEPTQVNNDSDISCNCSLCSMHLTCKYYNPNKDNNVEHCIGGTPLQLIKVKKKEPTTSVWHDANTLPSDPNAIIVEHNEYSTSICRAEQMSRVKGTKWAYIDDLLKL